MLTPDNNDYTADKMQDPERIVTVIVSLTLQQQESPPAGHWRVGLRHFVPPVYGGASLKRCTDLETLDQFH